MKGLLHLHLRRRKAVGLEPFPARSAPLRLLDGVVLAVGVIAPLMTIPQITKIYVLQSAGGVSALTWGAYAFFDIPWIFYGIAHRSRPIVITYILWLIMNLVVVIGALSFGASPL